MKKGLMGAISGSDGIISCSLAGIFGFSSIYSADRVTKARKFQEKVVVDGELEQGTVELHRALWNYMFQLLGTFQESLRKGFPGSRPTVVQILPSKKQSTENLLVFPPGRQKFKGTAFPGGHCGTW